MSDKQANERKLSAKETDKEDREGSSYLTLSQTTFVNDNETTLHGARQRQTNENHRSGTWHHTLLSTSTSDEKQPSTGPWFLTDNALPRTSVLQDEAGTRTKDATQNETDIATTEVPLAKEPRGRAIAATTATTTAAAASRTRNETDIATTEVPLAKEPRGRAIAATTATTTAAAASRTRRNEASDSNQRNTILQFLRKFPSSRPSPDDSPRKVQPGAFAIRGPGLLVEANANESIGDLEQDEHDLSETRVIAATTVNDISVNPDYPVAQPITQSIAVPLRRCLILVAIGLTILMGTAVGIIVSVINNGSNGNDVGNNGSNGNDVGNNGSNGNGNENTAATVSPTETSRPWQKLGQDLDGEASGDWFGYSVALSADGMTVAAGGPDNSDNGLDSGHVRIYQYNSTAGQWLKLGQDLDGEASNDNFGRSVALSADGMTVVAGGPRNDGNILSNLSGHVRIYQYNSTAGQWLKLGQDLDGEASNDNFGYSVALSADGMTVAAGAADNSDNGFPFGQVHIYQYDSSAGQWLKLGQDLDGEASDDNFGHSVALSADGMTVAAGGPLNDVNGVGSGHVRIYQYNSTAGQWLKLGQDLDGEASGDWFGYSVALSIDGMTVAAGAADNSDNGFPFGQVHIYQYDSSAGQWLKLGQDLDGEASDDNFGHSVALSADGMTVAAGGPLNDVNGVGSGHVRIYQYNSTAGQWLKLGQDLDGEASGDWFGYSVALSADGMTVAAGAPLNDGSRVGSGHVRCFELVVA